MRIAESRALPVNRRPIQTAHQQTSRAIPFPPPSNGLVTGANQAIDIPAAASILVNWIPTERGARIRGGSTVHCQIQTGTGFGAGEPYGILLAITQPGGTGGDIVEMLEFNAGGVEELFAATEGEIFNVTSGPTVMTPDVTGLNSGDWTDIMHTTPGGSFMVIANGTDTVRNYDGTTWTTPSFTGDITDTAELSHVWLFKNREFFVRKDTIDACYLAADAIAGACTLFPLGGVFQKGGTLLMGFRYSVDAGAGIDDFCCFLSSEGELAVYAGTDPSSDFTLQGVYNVGRPLGKHCIMQAGGDVVIGTVEGLIPVSQAFSKDQVALQSFAVSKPIEDLWQFEAKRREKNWKIYHWRDEAIAFVSYPAATGQKATVFVVNTLTGKWGTIEGWTARCWGNLQNRLMFGSTGGTVFAAEEGGNDAGVEYLCTTLGTFQGVESRGQVKSVKQMTAQFYTNGTLKPKLFCNADFNLNTPVAMSPSSATGTSLWDVAIWDVDVWDGGTASTFKRFRQNVNAEGQSIAVGCVILVNSVSRLECEMVMMQAQVENGELVV